MYGKNNVEFSHFLWWKMSPVSTDWKVYLVQNHLNWVVLGNNKWLKIDVSKYSHYHLELCNTHSEYNTHKILASLLLRCKTRINNLKRFPYFGVHLAIHSVSKSTMSNKQPPKGAIIYSNIPKHKACHCSGKTGVSFQRNYKYY